MQDAVATEFEECERRTLSPRRRKDEVGVHDSDIRVKVAGERS
jgi:hypothetical protein